VEALAVSSAAIPASGDAELALASEAASDAVVADVRCGSHAALAANVASAIPALRPASRRFT
jgi:hypothetical protein